MERRSCVKEPKAEVNQQWEEPMNAAKSYSITRQEVYAGYKHIKANQGAAGVDGVSMKEFEKDWQNNLYKIWNRMSSGSYFPPPVRGKLIPKKGSGKRPLGIPTVSDRIAQTVGKARLEPLIEPHFHPDSYGYRPGKSALDAVGQARQRCWEYDWVIDLDIKGFFDSIDHDLLMRAVERHTDEKWLILYIKRWLQAPILEEDGTLTARVKGTPQGGVISPLLANLFLHYVFDAWMRKHYPRVPFERYADDVIVHCRTEEEAQMLLGVIAARMEECRLELHPEKTKIVYCKDANRRGSYPNESFDFLGYTFRPREARNSRGELFVSFTPAISNAASQTLRAMMRSWKLPKRSERDLNDLSRRYNPVIRGWLQYYGRYCRSALYASMQQFDRLLVRWAMRKYKSLRGRLHRVWGWIKRMKRERPYLFAHWQMASRR